MCIRYCYCWSRGRELCVVEETPGQTQQWGVSPVQGHVDQSLSPPAAPHVWTAHCGQPGHQETQVDPRVHPPGRGQHPQHRHLCLECQTRQNIRAGVVLRCQHPPVRVSCSQTWQVRYHYTNHCHWSITHQYHHLVLGDHLHPAVDSVVYLTGGCPLHHHLCWHPAENAWCQCWSQVNTYQIILNIDIDIEKLILIIWYWDWYW